MSGRRIHVDQGRRGTNLGSNTNHPILRVDDDGGQEIGRGGTIELVCGCGCGVLVARFVQPLPDRAYVVVQPGAVIECDEQERAER